jgi:beta-galactosidase
MTVAMFCSNCDHIKLSVKKATGWELLAEADPDRKQFAHLKYPPFSVTLGDTFTWGWGDLRVEGYIKGKVVITKNYSGNGVDQKFAVLPDDTELNADGADATRVVFRVTDEFGAIRPFANDPIVLNLEGPAEIIGDNPFALVGGTGAVWIRTKETPGTVRLTAKHPRLGSQTVSIVLRSASAESV